MKNIFAQVMCCLSLAALVSLPSFAAGYDPGSPWPAMRHDYLNTGRADDIRPSRIPDRDQVPTWTFQTDGPIFSTPVVGADGTVYIGSADYVFYAIGEDGALKWSFRTSRLIDSAAALSDDGRVYVPGGDGNVYALDAESGSELWRFASRNVFHARVPMADWFEGNVTLSPDGKVLAPNDDFCLYGLKPDGTLDFESCTGGIVWSAIPTDPMGRHFFCSLDMSCYGADRTGQQLWKTWTPGIISASPAIGPDGTVYVSSFDGKLYALDPKSGKKIWSFKTGDHVYGSAAVGKDGELYLGGCDGSMYALRGRGSRPEQLWAYDTLDPIRSSPAVDGDGNIYFGDGDGNVFVLNSDGTRRWSINLTKSDKNDVNASIALGRRAFYAAMQDGRVIQLPYDYCLRKDMAGDPRCRVAPGEDLPAEGAHVYWMTPGGSSLPAEEVKREILPASVITLRLVVRDNAETVVAGVEKKSLAVELEPWFPHHVTVSMDHRFINIVPETIMEPGREYRVRISGWYRAPGVKLLGHVWLSAGKRLGRFEGEARFITLPLPELEAPQGSPLLFTHMSFYQPLIFPSVAQIGMDDMNYIVVPIEQVAPDKWNGWVMVSWPDEHGRFRPESGNRVNFPVRLDYYGGLIVLHNHDFAFDHAGDRFGWKLFRAGGVVDRPGVDRMISKNSLYGEGKTLSMSGSFYNVPAFGTPLAGTLHINRLELPKKGPGGFAVRRAYLRAGKAVIEYDNQAGIEASDHNLSVMLIDAKSREPLILDYARDTEQVCDDSSRVLQTEVKLPLEVMVEAMRGLEAVVLLDAVVIFRGEL